MKYVIALSAENHDDAPDFTEEMEEILRRISHSVKAQDPSNVFVIGDLETLDKNMVEIEIQDFNL